MGRILRWGLLPELSEWTLAPDSMLNKKIKEIMRYTGGHRTSPFEHTHQFQKEIIDAFKKRPARNFGVRDHLN